MPIRVGAVNYLNSKPLIEGLTGFSRDIELTLDLPSRLADRMAAGELDVGLIPVAEYFRAGTYSFIPNIGIASNGPVLSVTLFSRVPWNAIRSVSLDEGSRTSAALTKILLEHRHGLRPTYRQLAIDAVAEDVATDAVLLIGDRAMKACLPGFEFAYDLGQEWHDWTGLPMVFAVWAAPEPVADGVAELEHSLVASVRLARSEPDVLAHEASERYGYPAGYLARYFEKLRYSFGPRERAGLYTFLEMARDVGELEHVPELRFAREADVPR